jgi:uncharacterized glyoxalase superfamily protein PhnB
MSRCILSVSLILLVITVSARQQRIAPPKGERMYRKITANLMVDNVNETLDFYEGVLGFDMVMAVPEGGREIVSNRNADTPLGFAVVKRDEVELMFQSRKSLSQEMPPFADQPLGGSFTLYIEVSNAAELYENVKDKVTILKDLHTTFYGMQEFYIRDRNGCVLTFASRQ